MAYYCKHGVRRDGSNTERCFDCDPRDADTPEDSPLVRRIQELEAALKVAVADTKRLNMVLCNVEEDLKRSSLAQEHSRILVAQALGRG